MCVFHVKVVEVHIVRCYITENDARTLFLIHTRRNKIQFLNKCVFESENKGGTRFTWYNWKAHKVV